MALLQRAKDSGKCPPSLLTENRMTADDGFEAAVTKVLEINNNGLALAEEGDVAESFQEVMKMAELGEGTSIPKENIEFRRCIILAIVGSTPVENANLKAVLESGYLSTVKTWYDQILQGSTGSVDLLLHLLSTIKDLPVTKSIVKQSGMGKAIGSIGKHSMCAGTPNEAAIMDRVAGIKSAWNASVKARKDKDTSADKQPAKRQIDAAAAGASPAKRAKVEEKKPNNFSSLLKKVSDNGKASTAATNGAGNSPTSKADSKTKKSSARVKWSDHFGGNLTAVRILDSTETPASESGKGDEGGVSWTDRKKRDREKEKELLAKAKKSKLMDDDDDIEPVARMVPTKEWRQPSLLPDNAEATKPQLSSKELVVQIDRMTKVQPARYVSDDSVPNSPAPLSGVEQALDMTSVSSAVVAAIPFFVPQVSAPAPPPPAPAAAQYSQPAMPAPAHAPPVAAYAPPPQGAHEAATAQTVQSLGLPMFLVGQNVQALQTLASSPSLLSTLVEPNGMYDQPRLMSLVQTLSQNIAPPQQAPGMGGLAGYQPPAPAPAPSYGSQAYQAPGGGGIYGPASGAAPAPSFGQPPSFGGGAGFTGGGARGGGYRGETNSEGNLHVSGYGPTTSSADIINVFSPYVKVDEVVMKGTFCFVNTSDAVNAQRAREVLNGSLVGGMPIRINLAQRRNRDPNYGGGGGGAGFGGPPKPPMNSHQPPHGMPSFNKPPPAFGGQGGPPGDDVRDDRGNPATKNLFVAGYGPGTTEQMVRDCFGQYATIIGVVMKGTFSFVNTSEKGGAILARENLMNSVMNGGVLRINFAKETGRLGTSFDLTYGPGQGGPPGGGGRGPPPGHYGRGGY